MAVVRVSYLPHGNTTLEVPSEFRFARVELRPSLPDWMPLLAAFG
jgi:hypothetical protein